MPWDSNSCMKQTQARSACTRIIAFHCLQMYPNYLSNLEKMKWAISHGGYQMAVAVQTALALNVRMGEFCSMPHKLGWPYWAVCMSGLVMALVIFRSSSASLMGPWGPINSLRPCVQDTKAVQILLGSLILQRFRDKKFRRPTGYHQPTSPSLQVEEEGMP